MNDIEVLGKLVEKFIRKMTSPEAGQFRLEVSTFKIMLERARIQDPVLVKFTLTDMGKVVNNLNDREESLEALGALLKRSMDFLSSLVGEELARDLVQRSMKNDLGDIISEMRGKSSMIAYLPEPFHTMISERMKEDEGISNHDEVMELFQELFHFYLKELSARSDLSAFKLKMSILREKHPLIRAMELKGNNTFDYDMGAWAAAEDREVREALVAIFNSLVGLSSFMVGKEEATKKAASMFEYYFKGREDLVQRYSLKGEMIGGALQRRISTGIARLDAMMGGGIPKGSSILFISPSGVEKDLFTSNMLIKNLEGGSSVLMVLSKEPPRSIRILLRSEGLDPEALEEEGRLRLIDWFSWRGERIIGVEKDGMALKSSKLLENLTTAMTKGMRELAFSPSKVGLVHIIGPATSIFEFNKVYNFIQRLRVKFKEEEMASLFLLETDSLDRELTSRLMEVFDGALELTKRMEGDRMHRELSILSLTGSEFDTSHLSFNLMENQLVPDLEAVKGGRSPAPSKAAEAPPKKEKAPSEVAAKAEEKKAPVMPVLRKKVVKTLKSNGSTIPLPPVPAEDIPSMRPIRVRKVRPRGPSEAGTGQENGRIQGWNDGSEPDPEKMLMEAIATIDDLLGSSQKGRTGHKPPDREESEK